MSHALVSGTYLAPTACDDGLVRPWHRVQSTVAGMVMALAQFEAGR